MGRANAELIKAAEKMRQLHGADSHQYRKVARLVEQSQADCPHDGEIRNTKRTPGGPVGRICLECSKLLEG
jgi:hypothetical protein